MTQLAFLDELARRKFGVVNVDLDPLRHELEDACACDRECVAARGAAPRRHVMALIHDDMAVLGHEIVDLVIAQQALDHRDVDPPREPTLPASDSPDGLLLHIEKERQLRDPLIEKRLAVHEHERAPSALGHEEDPGDRLADPRWRDEHADIVSQERTRRGLLERRERATKFELERPPHLRARYPSTCRSPSWIPTETRGSQAGRGATLPIRESNPWRRERGGASRHLRVSSSVMPSNELHPALRGWWRITETSQWVNEYLDDLGPALISITGYGDRLRMHYLVAHVNVRATKTGASFRWEGAWEYDPMSGTGSVRLGKDGRLHGRIKITNGDESTFLAERANEPDEPDEPIPDPSSYRDKWRRRW